MKILTPGDTYEPRSPTKEEIGMKVNCTQCHGEFEIEENDKIFYDGPFPYVECLTKNCKNAYKDNKICVARIYL